MKQRHLLQSVLTFVVLTAFMALAPGAANAQTTVTIGTGTQAGIQAPIGTNHYYSFTEQLYKAEQIGQSGHITKLAFQFVQNAPPSQMEYPIVIYMKAVPTSVQYFATDTDIELTDADQVYSGTLAVTTSGWQTIVLDKAFLYDGTSNLMIAVNRDNMVYGSNYQYCFLCTQFEYGLTNCLSRHLNSDDNHVNIADLSSYTTNTNWVRMYSQPNVQLTFSENISFADANVKTICVQNWDTNSDGELSFEEAAAVTTLNPSGATNSSVFISNNTITSFNELQYFTELSSIDNYAFYRCTSLTSVTLPNSVTAISERAFDHCTGLTSITIPNSVITIGNYAFYYCTGLTSITIPNSVTTIAFDAFATCTLLTEVSLGNNLQTLGASAFYNCIQLTQIEIPSSVTTMGTNPFSSCRALTQITVAEGNTVYDSRNNCNAIINTGTNQLVSGCKNTVIPETVTSIGNNAFDNLYNLTSITIPSSVTTIGTYAFRYCNGLNAITIPSSVTSIGNSAFYNCSLSSVTVQAITPPMLGNEYVFYGSTTSAILTVPCVSEDAYLNYNGSHWGGFNDITCTNDVPIDFADASVKALCVATSTGWDTNGDGELSYAEAAAVTSLGTVFKNNTTITSFNELQYFTGLTSIDDDAFSGCWSLAVVTLPPLVQTIGEFSFYGCNFPSIVIPNSVTSIGSHAFRGCDALTSITIPSSVTSIGYNPFTFCEALTSITVEEGNNTYNSPEGSNAIIETNTNTLIVACNNTVIPEGVTAIGSGAFSGCEGITTINIPNSVTRIDARAFLYCSGLTTFTIPASVNFIGYNAFLYTTNLTEMTVLATTPPTLQDFPEFPIFASEIANIPVYVPYESLEAYQNYNNTGEPWGGFTNIIGVATIGTGTTQYDGLPLMMEWNYSMTQQIFTAAEIGQAGTIQSIAFDYAYTQSFSLPNVKVYMKNVSKSAFDNNYDMVSVSESDKVFEGTFAATGAGWVTLTLDTPFYYDGTSNLLVCFYDCTRGYPGNSFKFMTTMTSTLCSLQYYTDNSSEWGNDIQELVNYSGSSARNTWRNNIRLTFNNNANIEFADDAVKAICVQHWDTNGDGELSYAEAAAVTSLIPSGQDNSAFRGNTDITSFNELQYFTGLTSIETNAFTGCINLASVTLPDNITSIGQYAFFLCSSLSQLIIPNNVNTIWGQAFSGTALTSIVIPASVTSIGYRGSSTRYISIFTHCNALESITVAEGNTVYDSRDNCNAIIETATNTLISGCKNTIIPSTVNILGEAVFMGITSLNSITIPASVTSIDRNAFYDCNNMAEMTLLATTPPTLGNNSVFYNVPTGIPVYVPACSVADYINYDNYSPWGGFTNFRSLHENYPWTEGFEGYAGYNFSNQNYNVMPSCWSYIHNTDYQYYSHFPTIVSNANYAHAGSTNCLFFAENYDSQYTQGDQYVILPRMENVNHLSLSLYARRNTTSQNAYFEVGVMTDPEDASTFTKIGDATPTSTTYTQYNFSFANYTGTSVYAYIAIRMPAATNGTDRAVIIDDLTVSSANIVFDDQTVKNLCVTNWDTNDDGELSYAEAAAVTSLGEVFKNNTTITSFNELQYFTGVSAIEQNAFINCIALASVTLPQNLTFIGYSAFRETALTSIVIPGSVTYIDGNPFPFTALESITMGAGANNYLYCQGNAIIDTNHTLVVGCKNTVIPDGVTTIGPQAFLGCTGLTAITIPNSVTSFGQSAFSYCEGLTSFTIPASVTSIDGNAFYQCTNIGEMTVQATTPPTLGTYVFELEIADIPVYVPCESLEAYQNYNNTGEPWGGFTNFHTPYDTFPWTENFDSYLGDLSLDHELPACWSYISDYSMEEPAIENLLGNEYIQAYSGNNALVLYTPDNTHNAQFVILPEMENVNTLVLDFYSLRGPFEVGVMTDPEDASTFETVESFTSSSSYTLRHISFSLYLGTGTYIAIKMEAGQYQTLLIDDVTVSENTCEPPTGLELTDIYLTSWFGSSTNGNWGASFTWDVQDVVLQYCYLPSTQTPTNDDFIDTDLGTNGCVLGYIFEPNTDYTFYLRKKCSDTEFSVPATVRFHTPCIGIPYTENFDSYNGTTSGQVNVLPDCWSRINTTTNANFTGYPTISLTSDYGSGYNSPSNILSFSSNYSSDPQDQYAILPNLGVEANLVLSLYARAVSNSRSAYFEVGVMTDTENASTFTALANFTPTNTQTFEQYTLSIYLNADQYIAIRMPAASGSTNRGVCIDDLSITENTCAAPTGLAVSNILGDRATFTWDAEEGATWQFVAKPVGVSPDNWATNTNNYTVWDHLQPETDYVFYLRKQCSSTEFSGIVSFPFTTESAACAAPTNVQVVSNGVYPGTGTLGFTFSFTPGHEDQALWTYYISENPVLPTLQQMGANGWMGNINQTEYPYYPTGDDALEHNTAYYIWVGYDCGTNEYVWSEWPVMVTTVTDYEYTLSAGINWWTPVAEMTVEELEIALDNIYTGDILINSQKDGFLRREGGEWNGTLDESAIINPGLMLKIWTEASGTFWHLCVPQTWGYSEIVQGWNWIGCISATSLGQTFGNFEVAEGDKIVDKEGHTVTFTNGAWTGDINDLKLLHGKGYLYYSTSETTKIISF